MLRVSDPLPKQILAPEDGPVAEVINPGISARVCLVCEHASAAIPGHMGDLGLAPDDRFSHAVWDPGAAALASALSIRLGAPLYQSRVSRLVYDCNRSPDRADAMPDRVERISIPGNAALTAQDRAARTREIYDAFHSGLDRLLDAFTITPALVTIHSFSPTWHGKPRATEIGLLHDADPSLARAMLAAADPTFRTDLNQPYSAADGVTHMLNRHGTARSLANVMIEVRNDLLSTDDQIDRAADTLESMLTVALRSGADAA